jgi:hypothetical protein
MVRFVQHARRQMQKRQISEQDARDVLANPDASYPSPSGRQVFVRTIGTRRLAVVVDPYDLELVITAYDQLEEN